MFILLKSSIYLAIDSLYNLPVLGLGDLLDKESI